MPADIPPPAPPLPGPSTFFDPSKQFGQYTRNHHRANIARFRCKVSASGTKKKNEALIDSGATDNFFYDKELFFNYETMEKEIVEGPAGESNVIGRGEVAIPLLGGRLVAAYHVPNFNSHILAVPYLSDFVDITFSRNIKPFNGCFMFRPGTRDIVFETPIKDGLYRMSLPDRRKMKSLKASVSEDVSEAKLWHDKVGHISTERYLALMREDPTVTNSRKHILHTLHGS